MPEPRSMHYYPTASNYGSYMVVRMRSTAASDRNGETNPKTNLASVKIIVFQR